jgi:beta-galactosidase/beta-glucuronidase
MERDENHPRQQFARANWIDLCGPWQFAYDDQAIGLDQGWVEKPEVFDRTITVPFPPESRASGIGDTAPHSVVWYRRTFRWAAGAPNERLMLHFGAVDYRAQVWVNGGLAAQHEGGQTPFRADVTRFLLPGDADQVLVVRAEDSTSDLSQPRGKQFWEPEPRAIWYDRTTGIWQPVWLEPVQPIHMVDIRWTPDLDRGLLGLQVLLNEMPPRPMRLRVQLSLRGVRLADDSYTCETLEVRREIALEQGRLTMSREELLWSPRYPNLLDAVLTLYDDDGTVDEVMSYAGLRSAGYSNGRFLLNGSPYYLRMVLEQGLWPDTLLAAPSNDALRFEVEMTKALGFNGVRIHQKVEDPRYLYWCDKLGLLVWGEMANAYVFSRTAVERLTREWMDVVRRDFSHPCIVMWVPLNESWGVPSLERDPAQQDYVRALYHLTHALDRTRPVIGNDGWEHIASDLWGVHDYARDGATIRERYGSPAAVQSTLHQIPPTHHTVVLPDYAHKGEPIMLTECGGISYAVDPGRLFHGYSTVNDPAELLERYDDLISAILDCPEIAGFCYTQLTDTGQETNGLLTADRVPKVDPNAIMLINRRPSRSLPIEVLGSMQATAAVTAFQGGT